MFNNWDLVKSNDWRLDRKRLAELKREIEIMDAEVPVMSAYLHRRLNEKIAQLRPGIEAGVVAEFKQSVTAYQKAAEKMVQARQKEAARWDIARLASEKAAIKSMVDDIARSNSPFEKQDRLERLNSLYGEMMSGDTVRQRAAVEVFKDITEMGVSGQTKHGEEVRYRLGSLAQEARKAEPNLRVSSEMLAVDTEIRQAQAALAEKHGELVTVGKEIGSDPTDIFAIGDLAKAYKQVRFNQDGSVKAIYPENHVEVTGVDLSRLTLGGEK